MQITLLVCERRRGLQDLSTTVKLPLWKQIELAIHALDGDSQTMVVLSRTSDAYLLIGGQWEGRCLVNGTRNNFDFFSLTDTSQPSEQVLLTVGGQTGEYNRRNCVPLAIALQAARTYYETGELDPALLWQSNY